MQPNLSLHPEKEPPFLPISSYSISPFLYITHCAVLLMTSSQWEPSSSEHTESKKLYLNHALLCITFIQVVVLWVVLIGVFLFAWLVSFFPFFSFFKDLWFCKSTSLSGIYVEYSVIGIYEKSKLAICRDIYILKFLKNFTSLERRWTSQKWIIFLKSASIISVLISTSYTRTTSFCK